jgi:hypothetical protein
MHLNVQSLVPKIDLLNVEHQKFDILCFTETWLNTIVANQDISLDNFQSPFRKDCVDRLGGGVAIYVKNDSISPDNINKMKVHIKAKYIIQAK